MTQKAVILDAKAMQRAVARISYEIIERNKGVNGLCIVGIMRRGVNLAQRIADKIQEVEGVTVPLGMLDITAYRDDRRGPSECADQTSLPFAVESKKIVLVDDVIYTGRSVRAAIDALMAKGRPQTIQLAVLIDRGHRELPIRADFIGKNVPTSREEKVVVAVKEVDGQDQVVIAEEDGR
ncbi:MAG: bifunctional pyr operon transcriptional regulator/uracil phosphoribosyltransferase PyrR [Oscillospiraceae bacterium]